MLELTPDNVAAYLRDTGHGSPSEILAQPLSGGVANTVLKIFDTCAGDKIGTDLRSKSQIARGIADARMHAGACMVLKQPLPKFKTSAEWLVDIDRMLVERDALKLLATILPAGAVPDLLWCDETNYVLAISCAPTDAIIWKKHLLDGNASVPAAQQAGLLLAMIHAGTSTSIADPNQNKQIAERFGDDRFFVQQRIDPYLRAVAEKFPAIARPIDRIIDTLLHHRLCLIHGDYSPKNIFLLPPPDTQLDPAKPFPVDGLMLLDFEVAFFSHPAFDVATLLNHLLLKAFHLPHRWRPLLIAADAFWQTYQQTAGPMIAEAVTSIANLMLPALLLARIHGKSPVEYITEPERKTQITDVALRLLKEPRPTLDETIDEIAALLATITP
jgi:hypothetical protein